MGCGSSEDPHGPIGGPLDDVKTDDQKISVSCRFTGAGLQLRLEDPGAESDAAKKIRARARSVLEIGNGLQDDNKCVVTVTEYSRDGARKKLIESCAGNKSEPAGTCVLTGAKNEDGYAFNGTIQCLGMRVNNVGDPDYTLNKARDLGEPMQLQIRDCD